ncbi:MAG: AbrB/MazE/SpoVT family DNA-binding domain-containing protein [Geobacteraceae bacterium]|nr:AbrB/MazE/SpoVT family DNA-binding domain-containing protein [Geobacteraceae bacterium]
MQSHIIPIGNSKGIRLPATLLRQCNIIDEVELLAGKDEIIIRPVQKAPRAGWGEAFALMHERGEDSLLIDDGLDLEDWEWK